MIELYTAGLEIKLTDTKETPGQIEGYGAVFGNTDSHGDVILPGAFTSAMADHKARGTMPTMYVEHGPALGGSTLPDGVWHEMTEDSRGLQMKGKISALDTDHGKRIRSLVQDGALPGMSIGFVLGSGNSTTTKKDGVSQRSIKSFKHLVEVSLVTSPSNTLARVDSIKSLLVLADRERAVDATKAAIALHMTSLAGQDSPTVEERKMLLSHLQDTHEALTGRRVEYDTRSAPTTIREMETALREIGFSRSVATEIAARGFKSLSRDEEDDKAVSKAELTEMMKSLAGYSLSLPAL